MTPDTLPRRSRRSFTIIVLSAVVLGTTSSVPAQPPQQLPEITVIERTPAAEPPAVSEASRLEAERPAAAAPGRSVPVTNAIGSPFSASQGLITQADLVNQPLVRNMQLLENIPGFIVVGSRGIAYANENLLRGFLLEHGTDFSTFLDDVPMNLPSHAHAQGYMDLNSFIPELIGTIEFRKGPYYADVGDFSSVGTASFHYVDQLPAGIFKVEAGKWSWYRGLVANSGSVGQGRLLYAVEANYYNGPFEVRENASRYTGLLKYTLGDELDGFSVEGLAYNAQDKITGQIPQRAVHAGLLSPLGTESPTDFLATSRYTLNGQWWHRSDAGSLTRANVYGVYYSFNGFFNSTYFLEDPVNGDQFNQIDRRWIAGANLSHTWDSWLFRDRVVHTVGLQVRNDTIPDANLHHTSGRVLVNSIVDDSLQLLNTGVYYQNQVQWAEKVRTVVGARGDFLSFDVNSKDTPENSGRADGMVFSPKASLVLGPFHRTDFFLNGGYGFHSNSAQAVTATTAPSFTGAEPPSPVASAPILARTRGAEFGFRTQAIRNLTSTVALWQMRLDQELVFAGDEGTTEPLRASDRYGIEWTNSYLLANWITVNADYSWSHGRLLGIDPETPGQYIPEAPTTVLSAGPSINLPNGLFANLRFRYLGPRPLVEDNSASARARQVFDLSAGYQCQRYTAALELLNLFSSNGHDIDLFYDSALPTDPGFPADRGVPDLHFRRLEPFAARFTFTLRF